MSRISKTVQGALRNLGMAAVAKRFRHGTCVLMFHGLREGKCHLAGIDSDWQMDYADFRSVITHLHDHYQIVSLDSIVREEKNFRKEDRARVAITFDDGYASNYHFAYPLLQELEVPATIFVATAFVDENEYLWPDRVGFAIGHTKRREIGFDFLRSTLFLNSDEEKRNAFEKICEAIKQAPQEKLFDYVERVEKACGLSLYEEKEVSAMYQPLDWEQIREMNRSGLITIGAHTHHHRILSRCSEDTAEKEMAVSLALLREKGGLGESLPFAYPNGGVSDHDERTKRLLERHGISIAVTTENGVYLNSAEEDPLRVPRFANPRDALEADVICSGMVPFLKSGFGILAR